MNGLASGRIARVAPCLARIGRNNRKKHQGWVMVHRLVAANPAPDQDSTPVCALARRKIGGMRCALPLGAPMICGDTSHREDVAPDSTVISDSAPGGDVWFIRTGLLRLQRYAYDGRRQILSLFLPGEIVGYEGEFREGVGVETITRSGLCRIDRRRFDTMLGNDRSLRAEFFRQTQVRLDRLRWLTLSLGALGPEERLCAFLARSCRFMPYQRLSDGTGVLSMLLPRKDIADLLATTVESISRIVHKLSTAGVIEIRDPTHFRILDRKKLVTIGQVDAFLNGMSSGPPDLRNCRDGLAVRNADWPTCFCGR